MCCVRMCNRIWLIHVVKITYVLYTYVYDRIWRNLVGERMCCVCICDQIWLIHMIKITHVLCTYAWQDTTDSCGKNNICVVYVCVTKCNWFIRIFRSNVRCSMYYSYVNDSFICDMAHSYASYPATILNTSCHAWTRHTTMHIAMHCNTPIIHMRRILRQSWICHVTYG